jgi:hypothetical protein
MVVATTLHRTLPNQLLRHPDSRIVDLAHKTLHTVSQNAGRDFSGLGIVVYKGISFNHIERVDLRPSISCPEDILLGTDRSVSELLRMGRSDSPVHDGFFLFDENGRLTHTAQLCIFRPHAEVKVNEQHGTRFLQLQFGSMEDTIILTGTISRFDHQYHIFQHGKIIRSSDDGIHEPHME